MATVTTAAVITFTSTTAVLGGNVTSDGNATVTERGVVYATTQNPTTANTKVTIGTGTGSYSNTVSGLTANTTYYVRAYAINSQGTAYGAQESVTTPSASAQTVTDIEGNIYKTVTIGTQVWMAENLKTTKYNDGFNIPMVTDNSIWINLVTPAYCWYNNDLTAFKNTYGALYNWYTVNTGKLCPTGWHIPSDTEWTSLTTYLGGESIASGKLKEEGTAHWLSPNTGANNETGFSALPGGEREIGGFTKVRERGNWWSSTEIGSASALYRVLKYNDNNLSRFNVGKTVGFSVRCVKD